ncbi:hypothetical protein ACQP00_31970 [Dactylosporangium sp. CS-047395]|uniref:hypothetical protein n=1 Tax=Dactylosporangium sp. CS-047395 TaxID=3239936 RepID=UPI003D92D797
MESDYLGPDGASPYLDPAAPTPTPTRIGRVHSLAAWREPRTRRAPFLTAVAPGNIAFAAYQPHAAGVFSLHDPADDVADGTILSYQVVGWYADPAADVLAPARQAAGLAARLAELGWSAPPDCAADTTVCHGAIRALTYSRTAVAARPEAAAIAVGNTTVDAVTALLRAADRPGSGFDPDLLEAFQYDLLHTLDEPDGPAQLGARIHDAWFGARPGGSVWQVVPAEDGDDGAAPGTGRPPADPDWLAGLNEVQRAHDQAARRLGALQRDLYELWWKRGRRNAGPAVAPDLTDAQFAAELDPARPQSLAGRVAALRRQVEQARARMPWGASARELAAAIDAYTARHPLPPGTVLKRAELPAFRIAADPVVVIAGVRAGAFDEHLGADARGLLPCRTGTVGALSLPLAARSAEGDPAGPDGRFPDGTIAPPDIDILVTVNMLPTLPAVAAFPVASDISTTVVSAFVALQMETYLLDPVHAGAVAAIAARAAGRPAAEEELAGAAEALMASGSSTNGPLPAILPQPWTQPWAPLFLEWQVSYHPLAMGLWSFDGTAYRASWPTTWAYPGPQPGQVPGPPMVLSGRSLLTPQPSAGFKARLDTYLSTLPEPAAAALSSFAAAVDSWDLLSQALSGFNEQLALRDPVSLRAPDATAVVLPPDLTIADLIGGGAVAMPMADQPGGFQQMRAGQFTFLRVSVVDRFGQRVDVFDATGAGSLSPALGEGLVPHQPLGPRYAQLPPRLLEPARLDVSWTPGGPGTAPGGHDPGSAADLVCAWIVPSPLDEALACYAPEGAALGELTETAGPDGPRLSWLPAPGSAAGTLAALTEPFPVLAGFLHDLVAAGPAAFADLLRTIDTTLWTIDPPGGGDETYLAALAGRPLALVCAALRGTPGRPPRTDPRWPHTVAPVPSTVADHPFPVRVGDAALRGDGLIGYLSGPQFRAAYRPRDLTTGYVQPIAPGAFPTIRFDEAARTDLTLLMDPHLPVHLVTDVLPVQTLRLPQRLIADAMAAMALTVRFGPLLSDLRPPAPPGTAPTIVLPRPPQVNGVWSWAEPDGSGGVTAYDIAPADDAARFPVTPAAVRTGWLRLHGEPGPAR